MPTNTESLVVAVLALVPGYLLIRFGSRRTFRAHPDSATEWVLNSLAASLVIQILAFPITLVTIYPVRDQVFGHPDRLILWLIVVVLVIPLVVGRLIAALRQWTAHDEGNRAAILDLSARWLSTRLTSDIGVAWEQKRSTILHLSARWLSTLLISDIADAWDWIDDRNVAASAKDGQTVDGPGLGNLVWILQLDGSETVAGSGSEVVGLGRGRAIWLREVWRLDDADNLEGPIPGHAGAVIPASAIKAVRFRERPSTAL